MTRRRISVSITETCGEVSSTVEASLEIDTVDEPYIEIDKLFARVRDQFPRTEFSAPASPDRSGLPPLDEYLDRVARATGIPKRKETNDDD